MLILKQNIRITLKDLIDCQQGHDFILCLINYLEFYRYENRGEGEEDEADTIIEPLMEEIENPEEGENLENKNKSENK